MAAFRTLGLLFTKFSASDLGKCLSLTPQATVVGTVQLGDAKPSAIRDVKSLSGAFRAAARRAKPGSLLSKYGRRYTSASSSSRTYLLPASTNLSGSIAF
ncbi:hypothetical protein M758_7G049800 [Ceratodon purpureus]|nr:hypothetical protein M758_7G049800 [Ceratodon purpureus]